MANDFSPYVVGYGNLFERHCKLTKSTSHWHIHGSQTNFTRGRVWSDRQTERKTDK